MSKDRAPTRIQRKNRAMILEAALDVFSAQGFGGATVDQIAEAAGLSKPNLLYYFSSKEVIYTSLLEQLLDTWLAPMKGLDPDGEPLDELLHYVHRKLEMSRDFPRESRLFAGEIIQGAPRLQNHLKTGLKPLVDDTAALIDRWIAAGKLAPVNARHLIFSIWATTQHYADFDAQVQVLVPDEKPAADEAGQFLEQLYRRVLSPYPFPPFIEG